MKRSLISLVLFLPCFFQAQDTLRISLRQADSIFLKNNFSLLAARLNIDKQKAAIIQAKLYPNPVLTADFNAYDPQNDKVFHVDETGQKSFQVDQIILLGGKRKAEIELAKSNAQIAELEFENLLRQLKYELHTALFIIHQQKELLTKYSAQLSLLDTIVQSYDVQTKKGNIPLKESIRLKSVYLNLNNQRSEIYSNYFEQLAKIQLLLQVDNFVELKFNENSFGKFEKDLTLKDIYELAYKNRPDYKIEEKNLELARQYLAYQKKLAIPDVHLIASYDQRGGAFQNQINSGLSIPLPFWNRNQGNIKAARYSGKMAEYSVAFARQKIESEIQLGYNQYKIAVYDYGKASQHYSSDFDEVVKGITSNFQKRNITLIEFVDFFESYNSALNEVARAKTQLVISSQQLNYLTSNEIFTNE